MKEEIKLLVEQARNGSEQAFNKLYNTYKKTVWFTAYRAVHNTDVADDIVSTVFTKAYERLNTFTNHISFEMWLKTIALNSAIDFIRRSKKEQNNSYIDDEDCKIQLNDTSNSPEEDFIYKQNLDIVLQGLARLKKKYRDMIYMRLDGKSYKEIAELLAMPEATVRTDLHKARQRLRKLIE